MKLISNSDYISFLVFLLYRRFPRKILCFTVCVKCTVQYNMCTVYSAVQYGYSIQCSTIYVQCTVQSVTEHHFFIFILPSAQCLVPSAQCLVPSVQRLVPSAQCLVPSAQCLVPSTQCLMPSAQCLVPIPYLMNKVRCENCLTKQIIWLLQDQSSPKSSTSKSPTSSKHSAKVNCSAIKYLSHFYLF